MNNVTDFEDILKEKYGDRVPRIILDVAHNPDGVEKLLNKIGKEKSIFLCSISGDKDVYTMLSSILQQAQGLICTQASGNRAMKADDLGKKARERIKNSFPETRRMEELKKLILEMVNSS